MRYKKEANRWMSESDYAIEPREMGGGKRNWTAGWRRDIRMLPVSWK